MKKKKKEIHIVYIITKLELGGAQKVCLSLFQNMHNDNNTLTCSLISGNQGYFTQELVNKPNIYLLDSFKREIGLSIVFQEIKTFFSLIKLLKTLQKNKPNQKIIVHTHSTKAGLLGRWAAFFAGISTKIHTVHGFGFHPYQSSVAWFIQYILEFVTSFITTHYVCVSSFDIKQGKQLLPFFISKHSLIRASIQHYSALKSNIFKKTNSSSTKPFIFGSIACFKRQKNIIDMLKAFCICHEENPLVKLEIIGDGHLRPSIEQWIHEHNLKHAITLHSWQQNVIPFLANWHAFVLSSLWEGLPCAIIEARLAQLPVITYNTGGIHDIVHEKNGILCKPKEIFQLANAMITISKNSSLHTQLSSYNDDLYDFSIETMLNQHKNLYQTFSK